jgi:hypothetical protein
MCRSHSEGCHPERSVMSECFLQLANTGAPGQARFWLAGVGIGPEGPAPLQHRGSPQTWSISIRFCVCRYSNLCHPEVVRHERVLASTRDRGPRQAPFLRLLGWEGSAPLQHRASRISQYCFHIIDPLCYWPIIASLHWSERATYEKQTHQDIRCACSGVGTWLRCYLCCNAATARNLRPRDGQTARSGCFPGFPLRNAVDTCSRRTTSTRRSGSRLLPRQSRQERTSSAHCFEPAATDGVGLRQLYMTTISAGGPRTEPSLPAVRQ